MAGYQRNYLVCDICNLRNLMFEFSQSAQSAIRSDTTTTFFAAPSGPAQRALMQTVIESVFKLLA